MQRLRFIVLPILLALTASGCFFILHGNAEGEHRAASTVASAPQPPPIRASALLAHIQVLSSDDFEGRGPGTRGEDKTVDYLTRQLKMMGLSPGNPDGSFVQDVPLVGFKCEPIASFQVKDRSIALEFPKDAVALTRRYVPEVNVDASDVVFVGYGIVAPEYGWDDYKGVDVKGKTIVMLVNDPPVPDPRDAAKLDESMFKGKAMTYYGRWTYKYEIAAEKGAAAAVIVHETGPAGYPFEVVQNSWGAENFDTDTPDGNMGRAAVESWISLDKAKELFAACGQDYDALKTAARSKDFEPIALGATARFHIQSTQRKVASKNVIARLEGSDVSRRTEHVVYSAHWDHLGRNEKLQGDTICNGAIDNASGCAGLLELAQSFAGLSARPSRSMLFLFVTAEEKGLLGSKYYAAHPLYPLEKTLCDINMDSLNPWGKTRDIVCVGFGNSTMDDLLTDAARAQGRRVTPDTEPEKGAFYRSDHFEFAKKGVPALYADGGIEVIGQPDGWGKAKSDDFTAHDYHKPSDEVKLDWDLAGAAQDMQLLFDVGRRAADGSTWPEWKNGSEFKARREAMLSGRSER